MDKTNQASEKVKMLVDMEVDEEQRVHEEESSFSFMEDLNRDCTLTTKQFHALSYGSTAFLIGPQRQVSMMLDPVRIYATAPYSQVVSLHHYFVLSMLPKCLVGLGTILFYNFAQVWNKLLTLLAIILEFSGLIWYSLSYIPFARTMVSKILMDCFENEF